VLDYSAMLAPLELAALAIGLGCDAFAVAIVVGVRGTSARRLFRLSWHAGLFQFLMPIIGYAVGTGLADIIGHITRFIGGLALTAIALHMFIEAIQKFQGVAASEPKDLTRGWPLVGISVATSIDALIVGLWLGMTGGELLFQSAVIGLTAGLMAAGGMLLGTAFSRKIGPIAVLFGGVVLLALAVRMVFQI
jgi:putative Mn2+ efflux pump MntP